MENFSLTSEPKNALDISKLDEEELLALRAEIDNHLKVEIKHLNLTEELGLQYRQGRKLLEKVNSDASIPANQVSSVYNSVASMLEKIVKMQESVYSAERLKRYEVAVLKAIETLPKEGKEAFFDLYGSFLEDKGA